MSGATASKKQRCVIVLGQLDTPTDGVEDYCRYLAEGLRPGQFEVNVVRLRWEQIGIDASLVELNEKLGAAPVDWFLMQYTALAWSRRGFPTRAVRVIKALKKKARCVVTFHDYGPYLGARWIDQLRRSVQLSVMRKLMKSADLAVLTVPREQVSWITASAKNDVSIPVGANLPAPEKAWMQGRPEIDRTPVVAVFSISAPPHGSSEVRLIAEAVKFASKQIGPLRVVVLGRNSDAGGEELQAALAGLPIEVKVMGIISAEEIVRALGASDVLLFARGPISSNRGSAIAGIACGLPVIAQDGSVTSPLVKEAGVVLVSSDRGDDFGGALVRVLTDPEYRASLATRSRNAQVRHFSWEAIAAKYASAMTKENSS